MDIANTETRSQYCGKVMPIKPTASEAKWSETKRHGKIMIVPYAMKERERAWKQKDERMETSNTEYRNSDFSGL